MIREVPPGPYRLDRMAAAVGPSFALIVDDRGRPVGAREVGALGDALEFAGRPALFGQRSFVDRLPTQEEARALARARRVLAGGGL